MNAEKLKQLENQVRIGGKVCWFCLRTYYRDNLPISGLIL